MSHKTAVRLHWRTNNSLFCHNSIMKQNCLFQSSKVQLGYRNYFVTDYHHRVVKGEGRTCGQGQLV